MSDDVRMAVERLRRYMHGDARAYENPVEPHETDRDKLERDRAYVVDAFLRERAADDADPVTGWRPIESAPRDGTWFVIFVDDWYEVGRFNPSMYDRYVQVEDGLYRKEQESGYEWDGFNNFARATHWMPLPAPSTEPAG